MADMPKFTETKAKAEAPAVPEKFAKTLPVLDPAAPPPNLFGGTTKKLEVYGLPGTTKEKPVPGHELYWFHDEQGGLVINQALSSGWRFVEKEEIALNDAPTSAGNSDPGNHVRRWVGHGEDNNAIYAYLMKKPDWLYELHMTGPDSLEQRVHMKQEEQLAMGTYKMGPNDGRYSANNLPPGVRGSGLPAIKLGRYYKPPTQT